MDLMLLSCILTSKTFYIFAFKEVLKFFNFIEALTKEITVEILEFAMFYNIQKYFCLQTILYLST